MKPTIGIVGCGKVGTVLGIQLSKAGYNISGFSSKNLLSAKRAANLVQAKRFSDVPWDITRHADIVFITTPDSAIKEACDSISRNKGFSDSAVVLHCSGALPSTLLATAKNCGAVIGSMHPLQSFAAVDFNDNPFKGIIVAVEGEQGAVKTAERVAKDLGATSIRILTEAKTLYHASAVVASNYLVTLLDLAFRLIGAAGITGKQAFQVLKPLVEGTLSNIEKVGIPEALTGPIVRGDVATVEKHLEEMRFRTPELMSLYKALGFYTVDIAAARGTISKSSAQQLKEITAV